MMEFNSLFMDTLVQAHQEDLRNSARSATLAARPGPIRKTLAKSLIRLGTRLGGSSETNLGPLLNQQLAPVSGGEN